MTQYLKTLDGEYVLAELAMKMVAVAVRNAIRAEETRRLQDLMSFAGEHPDSLLAAMMTEPVNQKLIADWLGLSIEAVPNA